MMKLLRRLLLGLLAGALLLVGGALGLGWLTGTLGAPQNALAQGGLPYYRDASLQPRWDRWSSWQRMGAFALTDHSARPLDAQWLERGPTVVGFFYAGCVSVCPVSVELLRGVQASLPLGQAPRFLLVSVTPRDDSPAVLSRYAQRMALPVNWTLATGEPQAVFTMARERLLTEIREPLGSEEPMHANRAFLIDAQRRIRGIYDATSVVDVQRLRADVLRLRAQDANGA
jgi:cytochrome oxidase Cu insertion factor (SCO1/SenC/PrrC family)